jgi:hypothetical protein
MQSARAEMVGLQAQIQIAVQQVERLLLQVQRRQLAEMVELGMQMEQLVLFHSQLIKE